MHTPSLLSWRFAGYLIATVMISAMTGIIVLIDRVAHVPNVSVLYLLPILFVAVQYGTWQSLFAAALAVLEFDFFLIRPLFTFTISQVEDVFAFVTFVVAAVLTSQLAAGSRSRTVSAQRRAAESETLYELGRALMSAHDVSHMLDAITRRIVDVFGVDRCAIFVPDPDNRLNLAAETVRDGTRDRASRAAAMWAYERGVEVGLPTAGSGAIDRRRLFVPLRTADRVLGVMEVGTKAAAPGFPRGEPLDMEEQRLVTSFAAQAALVIAGAQREEERARLQVAEESDRLKSALLNAVSHDLRTPLAAIKASATALLLSNASWTTAEGQELLQAIDHETDRLDRLVGNLLDLSRIEAGVLRPVLDWYSMDEVVETARPRLQALVGERELQIHIQPGIPPVRLDLVRIDELIVNLVENAVKYSSSSLPIEIRAWNDATGVYLAVSDHGPGVPVMQQRAIFGTFVRGGAHGDRHPGTGLGLAICRGIADAHGGALRVEETPGGGATFVLALPPTSVGEQVPV